MTKAKAAYRTANGQRFTLDVPADAGSRRSENGYPQARRKDDTSERQWASASRLPKPRSTLGTRKSVSQIESRSTTRG
jgi:hypothetical protein